MGRIFGVSLAFLTFCAWPAPARADCLQMQETRDLIQAGAVIPLRAALKAARASATGDMIDGRLCHGGRGYQYIVTFLEPEGRVVRVTVDAKSGDVAGVR
jgi:uncharacterized membrane protein YkoI